jgi:carboxymethylenebutenolidase
MDQKIIDLYNDYIHGSMPRRSFLRKVAEIAGSAAAVSAILPLIETNYAYGQQVDPKDERLVTGYEHYPGTQSDVKAYVARPAGAKEPLPGILVIHENRGLNVHIEDVARRAALKGFVAVAPDGVSYNGGSPVDQEAARDHFRNSEVEIITADVIKGVGYLKSRDDCTGKVGTVGFCYGGGVSLQCAVSDPAADACVSFYGRALSAEQVAQVKIPLMMNYAGNDPRINAAIPDFRAALDENEIPYSIHMYPDTGHGFNNDTSQARYNEEAAMLAWNRSINFFRHYLNS